MTDLLLRDATIQQIQLELIRRASFNSFDGPRVADSLAAHADLWLAACIDRPGLPGAIDQLPAGSLITLRDLGDNHWNADTLFLLTENDHQAQELFHIAGAESWDADTIIFHDREETNAALGTGGRDYVLLSLWWD
ncbi:hypothetical protein BJY24_005688 [Nocardia transvalensis]|uniref:Uncharacterized protein n=1 Tax=Nocardia transvalensis TaxID=37333 RepID=A0A7W9PIK7_9NOCA|nr:hypothetical protein [Nocardia transvalensis]MBB5916776.1 hypothetical protein [Nocardia transvalensis]